MDAVLTLANTFGCGLIALLLVWAVLSPHVRDGVVIKSGLIMMALGFGSIAIRMMDPWAAPDNQMADALARSILLINLGAAVVLAGYHWRKRHRPRVRRRVTDWGDLDSRSRAS